MPFDDLKDKVIVITGGAGFLGKSYVAAFEKQGARVVVWDKQGTASPLNIAEESAVVAAVDDLLKKYGRLDVLINNAALNPAPNDLSARQQFSPYENYPLSLWEEEIKIGLTGAFLCTKGVVPHMKEKKSGVIINIGSTYGMVAPDNRIYDEGMYKSIAYATVKGAIPNFTRAWASYLGPFGVRVNCFVPGGVYRNQSDEFVKNYSQRTILGRMASPHEYNDTLLFLASSSSSYMTGQVIVADGGWTAW